MKSKIFRVVSDTFDGYMTGDAFEAFLHTVNGRFHRAAVMKEAEVPTDQEVMDLREFLEKEGDFV